MSGEHNVAVLCATLGVSRSGYYTWRQRRAQPCARAQENQTLLRQIRATFLANDRRYGSPRLAR